jgi:hypothetical protein
MPIKLSALHLARLCAAIAMSVALLPGSMAATNTGTETETGTETIILIRHGEKPAAGLGQLDCQGLNRALALPRVMEHKYGKPDFIFAPNPASQKKDNGILYDYVRPLATVEPSAIYFGLPINADIGFAKVDELIKTLLAPQYRNSRLLVAWEHKIVEEVARRIVTEHGGDANSVPHWIYTDFDSIYLLHVTRNPDNSISNVSFSIEKQGLNGRPKSCPGT